MAYDVEALGRRGVRESGTPSNGNSMLFVCAFEQAIYELKVNHFVVDLLPRESQYTVSADGVSHWVLVYIAIFAGRFMSSGSA